jgi:hypothetical protein
MTNLIFLVRAKMLCGFGAGTGASKGEGQGPVVVPKNYSYSSSKEQGATVLFYFSRTSVLGALLDPGGGFTSETTAFQKRNGR